MKDLNDKGMWRQLLARCHPDSGGNHDLFLWASDLKDTLFGTTFKPKALVFPEPYVSILQLASDVKEGGSPASDKQLMLIFYRAGFTDMKEWKRIAREYNLSNDEARVIINHLLGINMENVKSW